MLQNLRLAVGHENMIERIINDLFPFLSEEFFCAPGADQFVIQLQKAFMRPCCARAVAPEFLFALSTL